MSCPGYHPDFQKQLNPNDPLGSLNCLCYADAMSIQDHTCGKVKPTGKRIRQLTGDTIGGTTLTEVDDAGRRGYGVDLDVRLRYPRDDFWRRIRAGQSGVIYVDYSPFLGTKYAGSNTFGGTHGELIADATAAEALRLDALADGRRGFCNDGPHGTWVPRSLIDRSMDALLDDRGHVIGRQGGQRFAWVGFTRDNEPNYSILIPKGRKYGVYWLTADGRIRARGTLTATKNITGAADTPTRRRVDLTTARGRRLAAIAGRSVPLIRVASGPLKGKWINAQFKKEAA